MELVHSSHKERGLALPLSPAALPCSTTTPCQRFNFGGVSVELRGVSWDDVHGEDELLAFRSKTSTNLRSDIEVDVRWADELHEQRIPKTFESSAIWRVFDTGDALVFDFSSPLLGSHPYKRIRVSSDFTHAEVMLSRSASERCGKISPLEYPACELLITNHLAHHGLGVEVHGCGLIDRDTGGHLFLGHSGAGKSTTARLWESLRAPEILSDDRIILRLHDGQLWMHGTPWHGEAAFASPKSAKINRIHILQHGRENKFSILPQARAVGEVFARCFPPFYSPAGLAGTLEFIKSSLAVVPCYEFNFLPDSSSLSAVLSFHD
jgi:hypothetical protein